MLLAQTTMADVRAVRESLEARLDRATSLQRASEVFLDVFMERFGGSTVLARVYGTLPLGALPEPDRQFCRDIAAQWGQNGPSDDAVTLSLLASRGRRPDWNDRTRSRGHLALPLTSRRAVEGAPMIASLMAQIGVELSWFDMPHEGFARKLVGGFNGVFFVPDAAVTTDAQGRHVIPAQDFVREQGVRTVFGLGGAYLHGRHTISAIFFTTELFDSAVVNQFATLASTFKGLTSRLVLTERLFEPG